MDKPIIVSSKSCELMKPVMSAKFGNKTVLTDSCWAYVELYLKRTKNTEAKDALFYWQQARSFFNASEQLPVDAKPLTSYYCCLNAAKALLRVKGVKNEKLNSHGLSSKRDNASNLALSNAKTVIKGSGVLPELLRYYQCKPLSGELAISDIMYNIPCIHRSYSITFNKPELFIPIKNPQYVKKENSTEAWIKFSVDDRYANAKALKNLPSGFERDNGYEDIYLLRKKKRFKWDIHSSITDRKNKLCGYHMKVRKNIFYIYGETKLWYIKKELPNNACVFNSCPAALILATFHWLSELVRYDPKRFNLYMQSKQNWLLNEFINTALVQLVDEIGCEITGEDIMCTGYRKQ